MKLNDGSTKQVWGEVYNMCTDGMKYITSDAMLRSQIGQLLGFKIYIRVSNELRSQVENQVWAIIVLNFE